MKNEDLHLLINEEIYVIKSQVESDLLTVDSKQSSDQKENPPIEKRESIQKVKITFIHDSHQPEELDLLQKIVDACTLKDSEFKIVKEGDELDFEKAVIFTGSSDSYYQALESHGAQFMNSRPLATLLSSKEEKGKLWGALQKFIE